MSDDVDLSNMLGPRGSAPGVGPESGRAVADGIAVYRSPHGSHRYVLYRSGDPLAVLQVVGERGGVATVANVYTIPSERRRKHASTLLARARRDFSRVDDSSNLTSAGAAWARGAGNPLVLRDYAPYCEELAQRYDAAPLFDESEAWRWELLIEHVERLYEQISKDVEIRFVDGQPYDTAEQMRAEVNRTGVMEISREDNDHLLFTPEQNLKFRAVHDYVVHIIPGDRGPSFSERGEIRAYNLHRRLAPPASWPALFTEVAAQACYRNARGEFPVQKLAVMPGVDFYNVGRLSGFDVVGKRLQANPRRLARIIAKGGR